MNAFLYQVAKTFYHNEQENLQKTAFVFPNRRSGIFFKKYLKELFGKKAQFSPRILTINNLVTELSNWEIVDKISLLFTLYEEYIKLRNSDESFDHFVYWGEKLIADFDDVDKYMVDAKKLFANIKDLKDLEQLYLEPAQIEVIRQFWGNFFMHNTDSEAKVEFNSLWSIMYDLYTNLRRRLSEQGVGYEGMLFRRVAEMAERGELPPLHSLHATGNCEKIVFVGFNALTKSMREIMKYFRDKGIGDFYWDYYAPTLRCDDQNRANLFIKQNEAEFPSNNPLEEADITNSPELHAVSLSSGIGQVKYVAKILEDLTKEKLVDPDKAINTAVVLPDEELLMPLLYSIPEKFGNLNITMGYSLRNTSVASFFDTIFKLQQRIRWSHGEALYYHVEVAAVLNHRIVKEVVKSNSSEIETILNTMTKNNMAYVKADFLTTNRDPFLQLIFTPVSQDYDAGRYLEDILQYLTDTYDQLDEKEMEGTEGDTPISLKNLEHDYARNYSNMVSRLNDVIAEHGSVAMTTSTYFALLGKLSLSIPFEGEPLSGLQIMGVLETRALDFENIIILSMNEGVFPSNNTTSGFIPYNLRRGFEMATTEHQDSIYAYNFYRLIARAKRVYMLYDNRNDGKQSGEMSRFIYQLKYHYAHLKDYNYKVVEHSVAQNVVLSGKEYLSVHKTGHVAARLRQFLKGAAKEERLSASSIKTYINCPLQFYLQHVQNIKSDDEINEFVDGGVFGSIYHNVMASIYDNMKQGDQPVIVTAGMIDKVIANKDYIEKIIKEEFNKVFFHRKSNEKMEELTGENLIIASSVRTYVIRTLQHDVKYTPFTYVDSEKLLEKDMYLPLKSGKEVCFKAYIDRVDKVQIDLNGEKCEATRIVDYKTGKDKYKFPSVEALFDKNEEYGFGAVMQVLLYCKLYEEHTKQLAKQQQGEVQDDMTLIPVIYILQDAFSEKEEFGANLKKKKENKKNARYDDVIETYDDVKDEFEPLLDACIEEIFDESIPFEQTQVVEHCKYCSFKTICKRS